MTTLPQTSASRLARPPALLGPNPVLAAHAAPAVAGMTGNDVWRVIRANSALIVISVVLALIVGYALNIFLARNYPRFTSKGYVKIETVDLYNPLTRQHDVNEDASSLSVEQRTAAALLRSDALFSRVLQNPNSKLRTTGWFRQFNLNIALAKEDLSRNFVAAPQENSKLIEVSMSAADPDDSQTIVEDIVVQHLETQKGFARNKNSDNRQSLSNLRQQLTTKIADLQERQRDRAIKLGSSGVQATGRINEKEMQISRLVDAEMSYTTGVNNSNIVLNRITRVLASGGHLTEADDAINKDQSVANFHNQLDNIDTQLLEFRNVGTENRMKKSILERRQQIQDRLDQREAEIRITATQAVLEEARSRQQVAQEQLDTTKKQIDKIKGDLGELTNAVSEYLTTQDLVEGYRGDLRSIDNQLQGLDPTSGTRSGIDWAERPQRPDVPSFPKLSMTLSLAVAVGLSLSLGVAFLREMMDTTVRSPRDIAKVGQLSMLGMIPHRDDDPQAEGASLPLVIFHAPTSIMAEQYRQVRTRLQHSASLDTTRSILVTSPSPGDGKSVVASNLAASLALNGRRILLVDANFRRPDLHKIFVLPNETGLSDALASVERLEGAIQKTAVPNLDVLTTGAKPENATELLESQSMIDLIERALEEYDHIIFDSGPLLVVSETVALAPRVDGVITVVRASTNSRGLLTRMRDSLRQLKAEHLGVVLNGVRSQGGGYYGRNIKTYYEYQTT